MDVGKGRPHAGEESLFSHAGDPVPSLLLLSLGRSAPGDAAAPGYAGAGRCGSPPGNAGAPGNGRAPCDGTIPNRRASGGVLESGGSPRDRSVPRWAAEPD